MHFELKSISVQSIPEALAKVERYRLLNEPVLAESICLDMLAIVPDHQQALISLLLARTDQFESNVNARSAQEVLAQIRGDYEQAYYAGIVWERLGSARTRQGGSGAGAGSGHSRASNHRVGARPARQRHRSAARSRSATDQL